ncbi:MAG: pyrroline-5-carboxylate reductase family protein, partial [bacterium]
TPVSVGEGMTLYCLSEEVTPEMEWEFLEVLSQSGLLRKLPEGLMDAGMAVSGCGPAFAYLFLEALADGGVACGLPRETALTLAAQTLLGAAKLQRETGQHPAALKDAVCSPAGTTIAGVRRLEASAFRSAALEAVLASHARAKGI